MRSKKQLLLVVILHCFQPLMAYNTPAVSLGATNILDGGPIRPNPGWYLNFYNSYYHTNNFLDGDGKPLGGIPSPEFNLWAFVTQVVYQTASTPFLKAHLGLDFVLPLALYSRVECNLLDITSSGSGFGDIRAGAYLQWPMVMHGDKPFFVHRFELNFLIPTGKNEEPEFGINPGNNVFGINPYWAATLYFTAEWAISWRLHYRWSLPDALDGIQAGDAFHMNFSMEGKLNKNTWVGFCGYFLQQLDDNNRYGIPIPNSKERVLGLGPGMMYAFSPDLIVFGFLYFEMLVRNRTQGTSFITRLVKHF